VRVPGSDLFENGRVREGFSEQQVLAAIRKVLECAGAFPTYARCQFNPQIVLIANSVKCRSLLPSTVVSKANSKNC